MTIQMSLGPHQAAVDGRLATWRADRAAERLWAADHTLWTDHPEPEIADRLGWLRLPETMPKETTGLRSFADEVREAGFTEVVILGMGGSSLAPEVFQRTFGDRAGFPSLTVLDSTHPAAVAGADDRLDLSTTLFVVASKSGTTIEPLSLFEFFWDRVAAVTDDPGSHFAAITDPGSPLQTQAAEHGFRRVFTATPDVGGRYSALTHFGLVPAALIGADIKAMLDEAASMADEAATGDGGGFPLGAALGELALAGRDKATFFTSPSLAGFPAWVEQLVAESTGKHGRGILPVADEQPGPAAVYGDDRLFISVTLDSDDHRELDAAVDALEAAGRPVIRITVERPEALAAEMYRAEIAVAMAGAVLRLHPFNQPDVQAAKSLATRAMAEESAPAEVAEVPADSDGLPGALAEFLDQTSPGDYVAIQAFIPATAETVAALQRVRHLARERHAAATTVGFGPRFLHSTGQFHKGGPNTGLFLQIIDHASPDLDVPRAGFSFGTLVASQADGDHQALTAAGRRVLRVCLGDDDIGGLAAIEEVLNA